MQQSNLDPIKAWIRVSAAEKVREGRRRTMFLMWKKAVLVTWLTVADGVTDNFNCLSELVPRLQICGVDDRVQLVRPELWVVLVWDGRPMTIMSNLSLFSWR